MWLHESESNSIITEAYENKIFPTIIYISNMLVSELAAVNWPEELTIYGPGLELKVGHIF